MIIFCQLVEKKLQKTKDEGKKAALSKLLDKMVSADTSKITLVKDSLSLEAYVIYIVVYRL